MPPWEYLSLPEPILLPACPACRNRSLVTMVAVGVFVCVACHPARVFRARWTRGEQARPALAEGERAG